MSATAYTWTATDEDGDTAELTFMITVKADLKPSFGDAVDDKIWIKDEQIAGVHASGCEWWRWHFVLCPESGFAGWYHARCRLRGRLTGTPTVALSETTYTWTATDEDGDKAELTFHDRGNGESGAFRSVAGVCRYGGGAKLCSAPDD